jgi:peptidoglycan/LPS O-acetylase OafA/YrhL
VKKELESLQISRGFAALAVALYHARLGTGQFVQAIPAPIEAVLAEGFLGVDFFFVLSGFIILHAHYDDRRSAIAARSYTLKRIVRIYVPYLPITALVISAYTLFPGLSQGNRTWGLFASITLLPSAYEPALPIAWTLVHEILFYLIFLIFFISGRLFATMIAVWSCVLLKQALAQEVFSSAFLNVLLSPINIEFVFGLLCALGFRHMRPQQGIVAMVAGLAICVIYFLRFASAEGSARIIFGLGAALVILGLSLNDKMFHSKIGARLGDASYALYLIHNPLISLTSRLATHAPPLNHWFTSLLFSVVCSVTCSFVYHRYFERPALKKVRSILLRKPGGDAAKR